MNDLSAYFDGDQERERQICDLRVKGKTEAEVCAMLGVTIADIHQALDRAAAAAMTPQARVRGIYLDAAAGDVEALKLVAQCRRQRARTAKLILQRAPTSRPM
jgi:hypothetical protein